MANTRSSAKRSRQESRRSVRNQQGLNKARTVVRKAIEQIQSKKVEVAKPAYISAARALSKAASSGFIPKKRAARKISRLARLTKKVIGQQAL